MDREVAEIEGRIERQAEAVSCRIAEAAVWGRVAFVAPVENAAAYPEKLDEAGVRRAKALKHWDRVVQARWVVGGT